MMKGKVSEQQRSSNISRRAAIAGMAAMGASMLLPRVWSLNSPWAAKTSGGAESEDERDARLQQAASAALTESDGAIVLMNPQNGRVRAIVNSSLAYKEAFPPGSTIKPFTIVAAMRAGLIGAQSRLLCRERFRLGDFDIRCSHAKDLPPLNPAEALAYSCNYYFGKIGERMQESTFNRTLAEFGFGAETGGAGNESAGALPRGEWHVSNALGEGTQLLVTPAQMISAYAALVNGGRVFAPKREQAAAFAPVERKAAVDISQTQSSVLLEGMRGAIEYGTAGGARLGSLPLGIFGKTGTSTSIEGARTHGWFLGFASRNGATKALPNEDVSLAVLVFLNHGHGSEGATVARPVLEEFARMGSRGETEARRRGDIEQVAASARLAYPSMPVRVHQVSLNRTRTLPLEEYVLGVIATEGSVEDESEALKALTVTSRTYALKNLRRHESDGYDFCSTTHCQRFSFAAEANTRDQFWRAVNETAGEVLLESGGALIDSYFSASCGGMTADIRALWGVPAKSYLRGRSDPFCGTMPHHEWTDVIERERLATALRSDRRSDVGARLLNVRVAKRDMTGRAEEIIVSGERTRRLRGWDFKIIVGRALGWNLLKSSRFDIRQSGENFVFRGTGFGHGLGLCQEGAHVMAEQGRSYRQILERYFPGTRLSSQRLRQVA